MAQTLTEQLQKKKKKAVEKAFLKLWQGDKLRNEVKSFAIFMGLLAAAVGGRVALQMVPSVEPIIPLAILAGLLFGMREGAMLGGSAYIISNFMVWGLQGPWTIFQALGGAAAGIIGGIFGKIKKPKTRDLVLLSIAGTVLYEVVVNIGGFFTGLGLLGIGLFALPLYMLASLPFSALHAGTNAVFAKLAAPMLKLWRKKDELKIVSIARTNPDGTVTNVRMYHQPK